jgi:hypothetical protein
MITVFKDLPVVVFANVTLGLLLVLLSGYHRLIMSPLVVRA